MAIDNRYDFLYIFDVQDGNPNGDPDAGNLPRIDVETGMGIVTDVCLKRKIRNYVQLAKGDIPGYDIFIKEKAVLNNLIDEAHKDESVKNAKKGAQKTEAARKIMCRDYFDVRSFGAVMTTGENAGQVRGPIQLTFSRSVDPVTALEHSITRVAVTTEKESLQQDGSNHTMGRKSTIPYGLYVCHGFVSANLAEQTGFSNEDLELIWESLGNLFDDDRSASRGLMSPRALIVFKHSSKLGNAPASKLFDLVKVIRNPDVETPRSFSDYQIDIDYESCPIGVEIIEKI